MFDAFEPFLRGQLDVRDFDVILIVQPGFGPQLVACALRHQPDGHHRGLIDCGRFGCIAWFAFVAGAFGRRGPCRPGVRQNCIQMHFPIGAACGRHKGLAAFACRCARRIGAEMGLIGVPGQFATAMRPQVHNRRPAA